MLRTGGSMQSSDAPRTWTPAPVGPPTLANRCRLQTAPAQVLSMAFQGADSIREEDRKKPSFPYSAKASDLALIPLVIVIKIVMVGHLMKR